MERYGTIAYRNPDGTFGPSMPLNQNEPEEGTWLDLFARYLAEKLEDDIRKGRVKIGQTEKEA